MTTINQPEVKHIFIQQLEALRDVMLVSDQEELRMDEWVGEATYLPCGYAACVLGDYALNGDLSLFNVHLKGDEPIPISDRSPIANQLSEELDISCRDLTGNDLIAYSIVHGDNEERLWSILKSGVMKREEVRNFNHLYSYTPTPKDAAEYIQAVIDKLTYNFITKESN